MSTSIARGLVGAGAVLLAILLTGCSDEPSPTPSVGDGPPPTVTPAPTPASTLAPANTLTPAPTPATATLPLGAYLTLCASTVQDLEDDATFGDLSSQLAAEAHIFEALTPPVQLSEWHLLYVESIRKIQAIADIQPSDEVMDFSSLILIGAASADLEEKLNEVAARLPEDVHQQMVEAGCTDAEDMPDNYEAVPDDHGNDFESATRIAIREAVAIELENHDDEDVLVFRARRGTEYVITLNWEDYSFRESSYTTYPLLAVYDTDGTEHTGLMGYDLYRLSVPSIDLQWQAVTGGDYYIIVGDGNTDGTAALIVTEREATEPLDRDDHADSEVGATPIRVGTDVRGTVDFEDDIDYFRFQAQQGQSYQIDVALGSLYDSRVELYDYDGTFLDSNDDFGDTRASRLYWQASSSGELYVSVRAFGSGMGTYTMTVSIIDDPANSDDHADSEVGATAISVGTAVRGTVDFEIDIDFFRFQAQQGQAYQIDVALGSLYDSVVELYDDDGAFLDSNDDYGDTRASRLAWRAPRSGEFYVAVRSFGSGMGTYTLTVSTIVADGSDFESADRISVGEGITFDLQNHGDEYIIVFRARPGAEYVLTLDWISYSISADPGNTGAMMALYDDRGRVVARLNDYDFSGRRVPNGIAWQAVTGGDFYIVVGNEYVDGVFEFYLTQG